MTTKGETKIGRGPKTVTKGKGKMPNNENATTLTSSQVRALKFIILNEALNADLLDAPRPHENISAVAIAGREAVRSLTAEDQQALRTALSACRPMIGTLTDDDMWEAYCPFIDDLSADARQLAIVALDYCRPNFAWVSESGFDMVYEMFDELEPSKEEPLSQFIWQPKQAIQSSISDETVEVKVAVRLCDLMHMTAIEGSRLVDIGEVFSEEELLGAAAALTLLVRYGSVLSTSGTADWIGMAVKRSEDRFDDPTLPFSDYLDKTELKRDAA